MKKPKKIPHPDIDFIGGGPPPRPEDEAAIHAFIQKNRGRYPMPPALQKLVMAR
jgi:hypothetical protein